MIRAAPGGDRDWTSTRGIVDKDRPTENLAGLLQAEAAGGGLMAGLGGDRRYRPRLLQVIVERGWKSVLSTNRAWRWPRYRRGAVDQQSTSTRPASATWSPGHLAGVGQGPRIEDTLVVVEDYRRSSPLRFRRSFRWLSTNIYATVMDADPFSWFVLCRRLQHAETSKAVAPSSGTKLKNVKLWRGRADIPSHQVDQGLLTEQAREMQFLYRNTLGRCVLALPAPASSLGGVRAAG